MSWDRSIEFVRIPKERIGVLIGRNGETKRRIEELTKTKIEVDSETGEVRIIPQTDDPLMLWKARDIVRAIGRGFSPDRALELIKDDYMLDIIDLRDIVGDNRRAIERQRGRIIGSQGKTRRIIEEYTGTYISVYGKTVSIIGPPEGVRIARQAIEMLASGAPHGTVYSFLDRKKRELERQFFEELMYFREYEKK